MDESSVTVKSSGFSERGSVRGEPRHKYFMKEALYEI
jgi:hypothetical protein